ncbi:hypothetical protein RI367_001268 [Sorochytrium milnesiophthora]
MSISISLAGREVAASYGACLLYFSNVYKGADAILLMSKEQDKNAVSQKSDAEDTAKQNELRMKKAWDLANASAKQIPMNMFMSWMSGSSLQIFTIMIMVMMFSGPIKGLMGVNKVFDTLGDTKSLNLTLPKLAFVGYQLANMAIGLYKLQTMGLLPTAQSDWLAFQSGSEILEYSAGGAAF